MIKVNRIPFIFLSLISLLIGLWAGLVRIGWDLSIMPGVAHHGAIMVSGFLGSLIALEKIIPLKKTGLYIIPALNITGVLFFILNQPLLSITLFIFSSAGLTAVFVYYLFAGHKLIYGLMLLGALSWLIGNILLLSSLFYPLVFPWWAAFTLFIIVAERLEIMQFLPVSKNTKLVLVGFLILFLIGAVLSFHGIGNKISGVSLICIAIWLMRYDLVGITITKTGLTKFTAIALLSGYVALLMTGVFFVTFSSEWLSYDAIVHCFFIGFVFSMIFAHGPIILPSVLGIIAKPFHQLLYAWLLLLHGSWLFRLITDATVDLELRKISGLITTVAIVAYFITMAALTIQSIRYQRAR